MKKRKRGETKSARINMRCTPEFFRSLKVAAKRRKMAVSRYITYLVSKSSKS